MHTRSLASPRQTRPAMLLVAGLLAVAMHALGGMGLMPAHRGSGWSSPEICSIDGSLPAGTAGNLPAPVGASHDCWKSCAVSVPLLFADSALAVAPGPAAAAVRPAGALARPVTEARIAHPPRGPPSSA